MANQEHLDILKQGVETWNQWRREHANIQPDLNGIYLHEAFLRGADFTQTDLRNADITQADLQGANLNQAHLDWADFTQADLQGANLNQALQSHLFGEMLP